MRKRITNDDWKFQLKYSTKLTKRCAYDVPKITAFSKKIHDSNNLIASKMSLALDEFTTGAKADYNRWDCDEMYPKPKMVDIGIPKWLGGASRAAK